MADDQPAEHEPALPPHLGFAAPPTGLDAPPPPLPPPPGQFSGSFVDRFNLEAQLRQLREKAEKRSGSALLAGQLAAVLLLLTTLYLATAMCFALLAQDDGYLWSLLVLPVAAAGLGYALLYLARGQRRYAYHYRRAWQEMLHGGQALLFADDERLRLVQDRLPSRFWGASSARAPLATIAQRIEFCAYHLPALRALERNPEQLRPATVRGTEATRQTAAQLDNMALIWACCVGGLFFNAAWAGLLGIGLVQGPRVIAGCAALCAFVAFYLEEPRIEVAQLPPAETYAGAWQRGWAAWSYDGG